MKTIILALATCAALLSAAKDPDKRFHRMDTNRDGRVSLEEFRAAAKNPANAEKRFRKLDANRDGYLSAEEIAMARTKR